MQLNMVAHRVGVGNERAVVELRSVPDHADDTAPGGHASVFINDPDELEAFEEGAEYSVSFSRVSKASDASWDLVKQAKAIQNSTNTRDFKTPPEQKVPPPIVPDGVVTMPRPSVVLAGPDDAGWDTASPAVPAQATVTPVVSTPTTPTPSKK